MVARLLAGFTLGPSFGVAPWVCALVADVVPALLIAVDSTTQVGWGTWAWLLGVSVGAVLLPLGALANLLWLRIIAFEEGRVSLRRYIGAVVPIAGPALAAATAILALERVASG